MFTKYFHACGFFRSRDEEHRVMSRFVAEGLAQGARVTYLVDPSYREGYKELLAQHGLDLRTNGDLLDVQNWGGAYIAEGTFDMDMLLSILQAVFEEGEKAGFARQRLAGEATWLYDRVPSIDQLLEYEVRCNEVIARAKHPTVCCYQVERMDASTMMDLLRAHPLAIVGGALYENPFYTPPAQMLDELRARRPGQ